MKAEVHADLSESTGDTPPLSGTLDLSVEPAMIRQLTPDQKDRLTDLLDGYLCRLEKGLPPSRDDLMEANPDLAEPLHAYFESLDQLHDMAAGFQRPTVEAERNAPSHIDAPPDDGERRLGDFRLLREIGRGGMGVVYEAEQISLGRRVAVKVLPFAAVLDGRQIARFKHEAQAAAQLNHPNIVSVFAVGVERGVHYYAMQLIDGQPLDRAIAELRETAEKGRKGEGERARKGSSCPLLPLSPSPLLPRFSHRAIIRLGIQAAGALHAAHESGIVHRDIKPSNLLLDGDGKLWVTDFGLARRQTDPAMTRSGDLVGTLRYMSPEQALGQVALIDHRTDIYSLGATLYELLTLEPAFPGDEGPALIRHIERDEPRPPRQLQPKIPADLATVVLKGMAKRREDRYATAREFADDLQRVLDGKATVARPPTLLDRTARWALRHREVVAVAALVGVLALLVLSAATFVIAREQHKTAREEQKTRQNFALAEKRLIETHGAVEKLGTRVAERLAHVPGAAGIRRDLLRQTLAEYRGFVEQAKDNPALRADLASTYKEIGILSAEIGANDDAIVADQRAIELFRELAVAAPPGTDYRRGLGTCQNHLAQALERIGRIDEARRAYAQAVQALIAVEGPEACLAELAQSQGNLGMLQMQTGDAEGAAALIGRAVDLQEELLRAAPDDPQRLNDLALTLNKLGALYAERQPAKAIEQYEKAAAMHIKAVELRPEDSALYRHNLALTYNNLGAVQSRCGDVARAAESYSKVVDLAGELVRQWPAEKCYQHTLAAGYNNHGQAESKLGHAGMAEPLLRHAVALQETLVKHDPRAVEEQSALGGMYNNLGLVLEKLDRWADAVEAHQKAVEHQRLAVTSAPEIAKYREFLSKHYYNYGRILRKTGRPSDAARAALARRELWPQNPQQLFSVAEELALVAGDLSSRGKAVAGELTADTCGAYTVETLKQAAAAGWKPPPGGNWTKPFLAVKDRADFLALTRN